MRYVGEVEEVGVGAFNEFTMTLSSEFIDVSVGVCGEHQRAFVRGRANRDNVLKLGMSLKMHDLVPAHSPVVVLLGQARMAPAPSARVFAETLQVQIRSVEINVRPTPESDDFARKSSG